MTSTPSTAPYSPPHKCRADLSTESVGAVSTFLADARLSPTEVLAGVLLGETRTAADRLHADFESTASRSVASRPILSSPGVSLNHYRRAVNHEVRASVLTQHPHLLRSKLGLLDTPFCPKQDRAPKRGEIRGFLAPRHDPRERRGTDESLAGVRHERPDHEEAGQRSQQRHFHSAPESGSLWGSLHGCERRGKAILAGRDGTSHASLDLSACPRVHAATPGIRFAGR